MLSDYLNWIKKLFTRQEKFTGLKKYPIFAGLNPFELTLVGNCLYRREYKAGETVFEEGHPLELLFLIEQGEVAVSGKLSAAEQSVLKAGEVIGVLDFFSGSPRSVSATTLTDTVFWAISQKDFQDLISKNLRLGNKILASSCKLISCFTQDYARDSQP